MSLRKQAVSSMMWTFAQQFGSQIIVFGVSIILARILQPSDFGTIAMFSIVFAIANSLMDSGMASSLIRTRDADQRDYSTVFWFNFAIALVFFGIIFLIAPLVAQFYEVEILTPLIRVYSLILIVNAFTAVQNTRLVKEMKFKTQFKIQLPSLLIAGSIGIWMAYSGWGIWTLVYYPLIQAILSGLQLWMYSKWRPSFVFDKTKFYYHFNYGYKLTLSGLLDILFKNIYPVIIGKYFSATQLGYYNRADTLKQLPVSNLGNALNKVTFPLFAKMAHDNQKLREAYKRLLKVVIFIIAPVLVGMVITAEPLIRFLLTDKWLPAVPIFQVLAIAGILYPIHAYNLNILKVKGRTDLFLKLEVIKKTIVVLVLLISVRYGIMGIVWGQVFTSILAFFINTYYSGKILNYTSWDQIRDLLPVLFVSAVSGCIAYYLDRIYFHEFPDFLRLVFVGFLFTSVYLSAVYLFKFKEITYIKELIKK